MKARRFRNFLLGLVGVLVVALGLWIFTATTAVPRLSYTVTDLGTLGGNESKAYGINYAGQVVGTAKTSSGDFHAFSWERGGIKNLGILNGYSNSKAGDINNAGQVVGYAYNQLGTSGHAFLWNNGTMYDLGTLGGTYSEALDINNRGQVVGVSNISGSSFPYRAFLWKNGKMRNLAISGVGGSGCPPSAVDFSSASGINDIGQIVGQSGQCAFLWEKGTTKYLGEFSASDINHKGQAVGGSNAFLWTNDTRKELGTLKSNISYAYGLNNRGQVVGGTYRAPGLRGPYHAFIWVNGIIRDLNSLIPANLGWELIEAQDINNKGQIVGYGKHNGQTRAFLLTPT
jgi:probable HAF family extracellular repeat protein